MGMLTSDCSCVCARVCVKPSVCVRLTWHRQRYSTVLGGFVGTAVNIINITVLNIIFVNIVITRAIVAGVVADMTEDLNDEELSLVEQHFIAAGLL